MSFRQTLSIPLETDERGFLDRECPSKDCLFTFKVHEDDWKKHDDQANIFCPQCRNQALPDQWCTQAQVEHVRREAANYMRGEVHRMLSGMARDFNRRQSRNSFFSLSMNISGPRPRSFILPAPAAEALQLDITCDQCQARFAVIGSAFFCPCCGHSSAIRMFDAAMAKIRTKVDTIPMIRQSLEQSGHPDQAVDACRSILESTLSDAVTAFQRFCEELYSSRSPATPAPMNAFQRLQQGSELWDQELGEGYSDWLSSKEFEDLTVFFQRRHILQHNDGFVDQRYLDQSGDRTYQLGQRIVVSSQDALRSSALIEKIGSKLRSLCGVQ